MKTALKTVSTATGRAAKAITTTLRRWFAWFQMHSAERALHDTYMTLDMTEDQDARIIVLTKINMLSRELCRTRAHYQSFLPVGQRTTWETA